MKRYIIIGASTVFLSLFAWWLLRWLSFGSLVITTNDQKAIVTLVYGSGGNKAKKIGKGDTSIRVSPGSYTVEVKRDDKVTRAATTVARGDESSVNLPLTDTVSATKLASYTAVDLYNNGSFVGFLNAPQKLIFSLTTGSDSATMTTETYPVTSIVHWYNKDSMLFQLSDGKYYLREAGSDQEISISGDPNQVAVDAIDINNKGEVAYIVNQDLFYRSSIKADATVVAQGLKTGTSFPHVSISDQDSILVSYTPDNTDDSANESSVAPKSTIYQVGSPNRKELMGEVGDAHWSPNGKQFVATTPKGLELFTKSGAVIGYISSLGNSTAQASAWVSNNKILYTDSSTIWLYNTSSQTSTKVVAINGSINTTNPFALYNNTVTYELDPKPEPGSVGSIYQLVLPLSSK